MEEVLNRYTTPLCVIMMRRGVFRLKGIEILLLGSGNKTGMAKITKDVAVTDVLETPGQVPVS